MSSNPRAGAKNRTNHDPADELRRRARRRLVGAVVLFLLALVVVPALIQPGPETPADPIELLIPERPPAASSEPKTDEGNLTQAPIAPSGLDKPSEVEKPTKPEPPAKTEKTDKPADKKPVAPIKPETTKPALEKPSAERAPAARKPTEATGADDPIGRFADETMGQKNLARAQARAQAETSQETSSEAPPSKTKYWVQVAAVADNDRARALRDQLANKGFGARVEATQTTGNTVYRVRVGPFANASKADEAKAGLSKLGFEGRVVH